MDSEEREIFQFLQTWGDQFVSGKQIARRASGKKKFYDNAVGDILGAPTQQLNCR